MEKYMGYRAKGLKESPERSLPQVSFKGTLFQVDIARHEFRQTDNPGNRISMGDIPEETGFSHLLYDTQTLNRYAGQAENGRALPDHVYIMLLPPLKELDADGLAIRQGLPAWKEEHKPKQIKVLSTFGRKAGQRKKSKHL